MSYGLLSPRGIILASTSTGLLGVFCAALAVMDDPNINQLFAFVLGVSVGCGAGCVPLSVASLFYQCFDRCRDSDAGMRRSLVS